jgi:hypothetical protein
MLQKTFKMLRKTLFNVANLVRATSNERSFHRCCEFMCVMLRAAGFATFGVSEKIAQGRTGSLPPPARGSRGGGGGEGTAPNLRSAHREGMAHILQGIECPPSGEAFSDRTETMVGRIVGRQSSDLVKMPIDTHLGSSSGYHGRAATTAPNTAGAVLPGSSAGQVGIRPRIPAYTSPPSMFALHQNFLRCW